MKTNVMTTTAPNTSEYAPSYEVYVSKVKDSSDIVETLRQLAEKTKTMLGPLTEKQASYRYAPDKWTIRQMLGHMIDAERIFAYRALRIARNDKTPMEGFEQDDYVRFGPHERRSMADLLAQYDVVRSATLWLFEDLGPEAWDRRGIANKNEVSVRALAYIMAGHEVHHHKVLQDKYFPGLK